MGKEVLLEFVYGKPGVIDFLLWEIFDLLAVASKISMEMETG